MDCNICNRDVQTYGLNYITVEIEGHGLGKDDAKMDENYTDDRVYCASCYDANIELPIVRK